MVTVIIFLIVLAILIFVHELGHFLFAKMFGIRVDAFKIGFGPKIFAWTPKDKHGKKGETEYGLNLIPFGGYVKIFGENPDAESTLGVDHKRSMVHKKKWQQIIVLAGGVLFNAIFAWILYSGLFFFGGNVPIDAFAGYSQYFSNPHIIVVDSNKDSPAEKAGIGIGDVIETITSKGQTSEIKDVTVIQNIINTSAGEPITFKYIKNGQENTVQVTPVTGLVAGKYAIGIAMDRVAYVKMPFLTSIVEGFKYTLITIRDMVVGLYTFITGFFYQTSSLSDVAGPIGIAIIIKNAMQLGFAYLLIVVALISANLAIINLIPFPALDGGRIFFLLIEAVIRRPIPSKFANWANLIGFALLMLFMLVITYHELMTKIFGN